MFQGKISGQFEAFLCEMKHGHCHGIFGTREPSCLDSSVQSVRRGHLAVQAGNLQKPPGEHHSALWLSEADDAITYLAVFS